MYAGSKLESTASFTTRDCIEAFSLLHGKLVKSGSPFNVQMPLGGLEDEIGRFRIWAGNMGALQRGHSSLDYRLRDADLLHDNILKLLKELKGTLSEAISVISGERLPYEEEAKEDKFFNAAEDTLLSSVGNLSESDDDEESDGSPVTELSQRFLEVGDIVDNLYKLSITIRNPSSRSRFSKAASYRPMVAIDDAPDVAKVDLISQYEQLDIKHVREIFQDLRGELPKEIRYADDPLISRFGKAISQRRQQFMYWRRHREKLAAEGAGTEWSVAKPIQPLKFGTSPGIDSEEPKTGMKMPNTSDIRQSGGTKSVLSKTTATLLVQQDNMFKDDQSIGSSASTAFALDGSKVELPAPPKNLLHGKDFECPYCFAICPAKYGKNRAWRAHLHRDLRPYLCTYPNCPTADQLYDNRQEWLSHERWSHTKKWRCPNHPHEEYLCVSDYESHMRQEHEGTFTELQLPALIAMGETTSADSERPCPVCLKKTVTDEALPAHMANHLERIAAFALPRHIETNEDDSVRSNVAKAESKSLASKSQLSLSPEATRAISEPSPSSSSSGSSGSSFRRRHIHEDFDQIPDSDEQLWDFLPDRQEVMKDGWQTPGLEDHILRSFQYPSPPMLSATDLEKELDRLLSWFPNRVVTESECEQVATLLAQSESMHSWNESPRHFIIFRFLNQLEHMDQLVDTGCSDLLLPYSTAYPLPKISRNLKIDKDFLNLQSKLLSGPSNLSIGQSFRHAQLEVSQDLPFHITQDLGRGNFAKLDIIESRSDALLYVLKRYRRTDKELDSSNSPYHLFKNELEILKRTSYKHIVQLMGSFTEPNFFGLILKPVAPTNLRRFMETNGGAADMSRNTTLASFFGCLASALLYLHNNYIKHQNITSTNILVHNSSPLICGFSTASGQQGESRGAFGGKPSPNTHQYTAPEVKGSLPRDSLSDIWSLGYVFLEMFTVLQGISIANLREFQQSHGTFAISQRAKAANLWIESLWQEDNIHNEVLDCIRNMVQIEQDQRYSALTVVNRIREYSTRNAMTLSFCGACCMPEGSLPDCSIATTDMENLAITYRSEGRFEEARKLQIQVLEARNRALGEDHPDKAPIMENLAVTYRVEGRFEEAEELQTKIFTRRTRVLGEEHPDTLASMENLAVTYRAEGRFEEAEELQTKIFTTRTRVLGEEHSDTLASMENLAVTYRAEGRFEEARKLQIQVLEARNRALGEDHPDTLSIMENLAVTYKIEGRYKEAEELQTKIFTRRTRVLGEEHPDTLASMENLAVTYRAEGRFKEARELQTKSFTTRTRVLGEEHPDTLRSMEGLALTYSNEGRSEEAEELRIHVLETKKKTLGEKHPDTLRSMEGLADEYTAEGRYEKAEELWLHVLETKKETLGKKHLDTLRSMEGLAVTYRVEGRFNEAEELQMHASETKKKTLGEEHPDTLRSMGGLALTYSVEGRFEEAEELQIHVLEKRKETLGGKHPDTLRSMESLAVTYSAEGRYGKAEELQMHALETRKETLGEKHPDTLRSMESLAVTYQDEGRLEKAEELWIQVLEARKETLGEEHPNTLRSMEKLAVTYGIENRFKEAGELQIQVLETRKETLGEKHPDTLRSMEKLAEIYQDEGRLEKAEELRIQLLDTRKETLGEKHPHTLASIEALAVIYQDEGRLEKAEELRMQVLETMKETLGEKHPDTLRSMESLAGTYQNQGRWGEAEGLEVSVLETRKRTLGDEHPDTLTSMTKLANTYRSQGRWGEAEGLEVSVLETRKRTLGDEHPDTLMSMANLASNNWNQSQWSESEELQVRVLELRKRTLGDEHPDTLTSMANLSSTYQSRGRWDEAENLQIQVLEKRKETLGEKHPDTLRSMESLAGTYQKQGRWGEAENLQIQVLEKRKETLGEKHPDTLASMEELAEIYRYGGRSKKAEELRMQVLETMKETLGEKHPDTLASMEKLAGIYRYRGRYEKAEELRIQVLETRKETLGEKHPDTLASMEKLAKIYQDEGRLDKAEELRMQALETMKETLGEEHPDTLASMEKLAGIYRYQGRSEKVEELRIQVLETRKETLGEEHPDTLRSMDELAEMYSNEGRSEKAKELRMQVLETMKKTLGEKHPNTLTSMENWQKYIGMEVDMRKRRSFGYNT